MTAYKGGSRKEGKKRGGGGGGGTLKTIQDSVSWDVDAVSREPPEAHQKALLILASTQSLTNVARVISRPSAPIATLRTIRQFNPRTFYWLLQ